MARADMEAAIKELGLSVVAEFVPWSKSRNYKPGSKSCNDLSLNWRVSIHRAGQPTTWQTDYSAGVAHCPAYKSCPGLKTSIWNTERMTAECETGKTYVNDFTSGKAILPDSADVIWSLTQDADVLNYSTFEEWASEFEYDVDSRKAEGIYRACLNIALKLRNAIGEDGLRKLKEAGQDY